MLSAHNHNMAPSMTPAATPTPKPRKEAAKGGAVAGSSSGDKVLGWREVRACGDFALVCAGRGAGGRGLSLALPLGVRGGLRGPP